MLTHAQLDAETDSGSAKDMNAQFVGTTSSKKASNAITVKAKDVRTARSSRDSNVEGLSIPSAIERPIISVGMALLKEWNSAMTDSHSEMEMAAPFSAELNKDGFVQLRTQEL